jgi:drug/metabolite transporter (DMT)-like permease
MSLLLLLLNGTLIAGIYVLAKLVRADGLSPLGVLVWQLLIAAPAVTGVAALAGRLPTLNRATVRYAAVAGALGISAPNVITFTALAHIPAGVVGVIGALSPLFTYLIALAMRVERVRRWGLVGVLLGLAGTLALVLPRSDGIDAHMLPWALLAVAGPLFLAAGNLFRSLAWPPDLHPLSAASLMLMIQALVLVPAALFSGHLQSLDTLAVDTRMALVAAGLLTTLFYLTAFELQRIAGPVVVGQLGYVITLATIALGVLIFGERHGIATVAAMLTVLAGIALLHASAGRKP